MFCLFSSKPPLLANNKYSTLCLVVSLSLYWWWCKSYKIIFIFIILYKIITISPVNVVHTNKTPIKKERFVWFALLMFVFLFFLSFFVFIFPMQVTWLCYFFKDFFVAVLFMLSHYSHITCSLTRFSHNWILFIWSLLINLMWFHSCRGLKKNTKGKILILPLKAKDIAIATHLHCGNHVKY